MMDEFNIVRKKIKFMKSGILVPTIPLDITTSLKTIMCPFWTSVIQHCLSPCRDSQYSRFVFRTGRHIVPTSGNKFAIACQQNVRVKFPEN